MLTRQHIESCERGGGRISYQRRRPAHLLQIASPVRGFDLLELTDAAIRTHHLHPAVVRAGGDSIHLVERIVAVFLVPKISGKWIETQAESVTHAVRIEL